jgi:hypothetical protein
MTRRFPEAGEAVDRLRPVSSQHFSAQPFSLPAELVFSDRTLIYRNMTIQ